MNQPSQQPSKQDIIDAVECLKRAEIPSDMMMMVLCPHCKHGHNSWQPLPEGCKLLDDISTNQPK